MVWGVFQDSARPAISMVAPGGVEVMLSSPVVGAAGEGATGSRLAAFSRFFRGAVSRVSVETGNKFTGSCGVDAWIVLVSATGSGGGALVRWRKDMASAETTNSNATTAPTSFHWVISLEGIFSALATLAGAGFRVAVDVADGAALIPEDEAVGDGSATTSDGVRGGAGEGAETIGAAGATTAGIFC